VRMVQRVQVGDVDVRVGSDVELRVVSRRHGARERLSELVSHGSVIHV
jgi:hypothetical protein